MAPEAAATAATAPAAVVVAVGSVMVVLVMASGEFSAVDGGGDDGLATDRGEHGFELVLLVGEVGDALEWCCGDVASSHGSTASAAGGA